MAPTALNQKPPPREIVVIVSATRVTARWGCPGAAMTALFAMDVPDPSVDVRSLRAVDAAMRRGYGRRPWRVDLCDAVGADVLHEGEVLVAFFSRDVLGAPDAVVRWEDRVERLGSAARVFHFHVDGVRNAVFEFDRHDVDRTPAMIFPDRATAEATLRTHNVPWEVLDAAAAAAGQTDASVRFEGRATLVPYASMAALADRAGRID